MADSKWCLQFEPHRAYLEVIAESRMEPKLRRKIDPQDVVQDTFMAAHLARPTAPVNCTSEEMRKWLVVILKNKLIDLKRQYYGAKRDLLQENSVDDVMDRSIRGIEAIAVAMHTSPSGVAIRNEQLAKLANAIRLLEKGQREVIVERYINQRNLAGTCEVLGKSEKSVAGLLYRGMLKLRKLLAESDSSINS